MRRWRSCCADGTAALALLSFLIAASQTFPLTAYSGLLNIELQLSQSEQSLYYAATFLPVVIKPAYALLSDGLPICGYRRWPYFVLSTLGMTAAYLVTALFVTTARGVLLVSMLRSMCCSCAELMLAATLVDLVRRGGLKETGLLQSCAVGGRYAGSIFASLAGIVAYSLRRRASRRRNSM